MRKFRVQISNRLFFSDEDVSRSGELVKKLAELEAEYPEAVKKSEEAKEQVWISFEALRKANVLAYSATTIQKLRGDLYRAQAAVTVPLKEHSDRRNELLWEIERLTRELRHDIRGHIEDYILEVEGIKTFEELSRSPDFNMEITVKQDNYAACEKMLNALVKFKGKIIAMTRQSFNEILEEVKGFETEANDINVFLFEKEEILHRREMRVSG